MDIDFTQRLYKKTATDRDISVYQVNEAAPTDAYFKGALERLMAQAASKPDTLAGMRRYVGQWNLWLRLGLSTVEGFGNSVQTLLPSVFSCWTPGARA